MPSRRRVIRLGFYRACVHELLHLLLYVRTDQRFRGNRCTYAPCTVLILHLRTTVPHSGRCASRIGVNQLVVLEVAELGNEFLTHVDNGIIARLRFYRARVHVRPGQHSAGDGCTCYVRARLFSSVYVRVRGRSLRLKSIIGDTQLLLKFPDIRGAKTCMMP